MKCETCGKEHDGKYGSGRFCSNKCARAYSSKHVTKEGKRKQKEALTNKENRAKALSAWMTRCNYEQDSDGSWNRSEEPCNDHKKSKKKHKHTLTLGKIGELKTAQKFLNHGYEVFVPLVDISGTDMIVEKDNTLKKIQVKSATSSTDNSTVFSLRSNDFNMKNGNVTSYSKKYKKQNVDYFALYSEKDDDVYLIENDESHTSFTIRNNLSDDNLTTKGKNLEKLHMAYAYQIDKVLDDIDNGISQLNIVAVDDSDE